MRKYQEIEYHRVFSVIEGLCILKEEGSNPKKLIDEIYTYAHLFSDCENYHENWREQFYKTEKALKKNGII